MSFAGQAINRLKDNLRLRQSYRSRHNQIRQAFTNELHYISYSEPKPRNISNAELQKIKEKIRKNIRKERKLYIIKTVLVSSILITITLYLFYKLLFT